MDLYVKTENDKLKLSATQRSEPAPYASSFVHSFIVVLIPSFRANGDIWALPSVPELDQLLEKNISRVRVILSIGIFGIGSKDVCAFGTFYFGKH